MTTRMEFLALTKMMREYYDKLREDLFREVANQVEGSRRQLWSGNEWCCKDMKHFAKKFFCAPTPNSGESFFGTQFLIRDRVMNYCPFCGSAANRAYQTDDSTVREMMRK